MFRNCKSLYIINPWFFAVHVFAFVLKHFLIYLVRVFDKVVWKVETIDIYNFLKALSERYFSNFYCILVAQAMQIWSMSMNWTELLKNSLCYIPKVYQRLILKDISF